MPGSRLIGFAGLVLLALFLLQSAHLSSAGAAPLDPRAEDWEGLTQLVLSAQSALGTQRVIVVVPPATRIGGPAPRSQSQLAQLSLGAKLDLGELKRSDAVWIIHPEGPIDADELDAFMRAGGRLVLLDDYGTGDGLLGHFRIRRVPMPDRPARELRGNPALAVAEREDVHDPAQGLSRVALNHATALERAEPPPLARLLVVRASNGPDATVGLKGRVGEGRLVAIGDSSVFINEMLRFPGNRKLLEDLLRESPHDDPGAPAEGRLFIAIGEFEMTGAFGGDSGIGSTAMRAGRWAGDALERVGRDGLPPFAAYLATAAIAFLAMLWTGLRAGKVHRPIPQRFARPVPIVRQGGFAGRAAALGAPRSAKRLAALELLRALEEGIAGHLGLDRLPAHDALAAKAHAAGLLNDEKAQALARLFRSLAAVAAMPHRHATFERLRDAQVREWSARVNDLLSAAAEGAVHGKIGPP